LKPISDKNTFVAPDFFYTRKYYQRHNEESCCPSKMIEPIPSNSR